ncbi:unnamed protein product, partial [marine sediment metagenome]
QILVDYIRSHGIKVKKIWIRSPHTLAFFLSMFFLKIGFYRVSSNPIEISEKILAENTNPQNSAPWNTHNNPWRDTFSDKEGNIIVREKIPAVNTNPWFKRLWCAIEVASVLPLILFRVYIPLLLGYTLVAERYVIDSIVTIAYFINDFGFLTSLGARLLLQFIPKDAVFIHLDSDYKTLMKRRGRNVEVKNFIDFQRVAYEKMEKLVNVISINTSILDIRQTSEKIMQALEITHIIDELD